MHTFACVLALLASGCGGSALQSTDVSQDAKAAPRATVVLVHGMGGFKDVLGIDYFWHVPALYKAQGAKVFVPGLSSFDSIEARAQELKSQLDQVSGPLVIVAHSQGGLDARWLITRLGYDQRVEALITIATPHHGSPVADAVSGLISGPVEDLANVLISVFGWTLKGANELTTDHMNKVFNPSVPDSPLVTYWSYSGQATPLGLGSNEGWVHSELLPTWTFLKAQGLQNDGMVPEPSAHWGKYRGIVPADHMGEVDQPLGETPDFDAQGFYKSLLKEIAAQGW